MKNFYTFLIAVFVSGLGFGQATQIVGGTQPTGRPTSSLEDTNFFEVFKFTLNDDVADGLPTILLNVNLQSLGSANLQNTIEGVRLISNGNPLPSLGPQINPNSIDIGFSSTNPVTIPNGTSQTFTVQVYFKGDGNLTGAGPLVDNSTFSFFISSVSSGFGVSTSPASSPIANPSSNIPGNTFTVIVEADQLRFLQQPTDVALGAVMSPAVQVGWTDENGNVDMDYTDEILIESVNGSLFTASTDIVESVNGVGTFNDLIFITEFTGEILTALDINEGLTLDNFDSGSFNITAAPSPTTYTYNGSWTPSNPNGVSASSDAIQITSGNAAITTNTDISTVTVSPGASLTINSGVTFRVINNITLESSSTSYSSFIFNGNPTINIDGGTVVAGNINYKRFVNSNANGNDLISSPLTGIKWVDDFLNPAKNTNAADLLDNGATPKLYAFGPFEKSSGTYLTWSENLSTQTLDNGTGYRAATDSGTTLTFTGDVATGQVPVTVTFLTSPTATFAEWNLIGNPYPSYIDMQAFLSFVIDDTTDPDTRNIDRFAENGGIYGYDGNASDGWKVTTLANPNEFGPLMAPGQGFLVPATSEGTGTQITSGLIFDPSMRRTGTSDDFIQGRNSEVATYLKLSASSAANNYSTRFYFNENSSLGSDHGYDGKILGTPPNFALYSHLVQDNTGVPIALQSLNHSDLVNTTVIPLGVNCNAGEQITITIAESTLPDGIEVYLEDTVTNTFTLLNSGDYTLTPSLNLNGTGRFYLRFGEGALSTIDTTLADLNIFTNQNEKTIVIAGQLLEPTTASVFDLQGRLVNTTSLVTTSRSQNIDVSNLSSGVYVVQLNNGTQNKTQKVILR